MISNPEVEAIADNFAAESVQVRLENEWLRKILVERETMLQATLIEANKMDMQLQLLRKELDGYIAQVTSNKPQ